MSRNRTKDGSTPCCSEGMDWPGPGGNMRRMMQACSCSGWLRRHRLAAFTAMIVVGLGFLALQVGWILGVIAFFRTL